MQNEAGGPQFELTHQPETGPESGEQPREKDIEKQRSASQEAGVGKRAPQPGSTAVPDIAQLPQAPITIPSEPAGQTKTPAPSSPATADLGAADADLIEKPWVDRAKSVASQTKDDPHRQKNEMSKIKADYIHKRFKKVVKTDEAAA